MTEAKPRIVIAGGSGLIGQALIRRFHPRADVTVLSRSKRQLPNAEVATWNPSAAREGDSGALGDLAGVLNGARAVINLAGSSIADGRFDATHRQRILQSRLDATSTLVEAAGRAEVPPAVWFQASATGLYGDQGDRVLNEEAATDAEFFLSDVGRAWEAAAQPAGAFSRRVVGRIGIVFDPDAEAWRKLVLPVKLFAGGPIGPGTQWWPWVHLSDLSRAIVHLVESDDARGVYNLVAPEPARQIDITRAIAQHLRRPVWLPTPLWALRVALGGMPDMLLRPSTRAIPERLQGSGFTFNYGTLEAAVPDLLSRPEARS
jgi:uncharacterized protein (TIGR01777 family)